MSSNLSKYIHVQSSYLPIRDPCYVSSQFLYCQTKHLGGEGSKENCMGGGGGESLKGWPNIFQKCHLLAKFPIFGKKKFGGVVKAKHHPPHPPPWNHVCVKLLTAASKLIVVVYVDCEVKTHYPLSNKVFHKM